MRDALAIVVVEQRREWDHARQIMSAEAARLVAEAGRTIAELRAELFTLRAEWDARLTERLAALKDGAPGEPGPQGPAGAPGHDGAPGSDGAPGREWTPRGLFQAEESYSRCDVVALDGGSFVALADNPGPCPGDGWRQIVSRGKPGQRGERGERGERGASATTAIVGWTIETETARAFPVFADGTEGAPLELRAMLEWFRAHPVTLG